MPLGARFRGHDERKGRVPSVRFAPLGGSDSTRGFILRRNRQSIIQTGFAVARGEPLSSNALRWATVIALSHDIHCVYLRLPHRLIDTSLEGLIEAIRGP